MMALFHFSKCIWQGLQNWLGTGLRTPLAHNYQTRDMVELDGQGAPT
jgi:hypothetical protein